MGTLRKWRITLASAAVTCAVLLGGGYALLHRGPEVVRPAPVTPPASTGAGPARTPGTVGPEGVPLTGGVPLGPARSPSPGHASGGVPCGSSEQRTYHVHARLTLFVRGKPRAVPLGVGIGPPVTITKSDRGEFASGGACFAFLHTHAADGIIHIESPGPVDFRLGQFFDVWRQRLDSRHLGSNAGRVTAFVNGRRYRGDPRGIVLRKHAQIQLEIGQPLVSPRTITFPSTL